MCCNKDTDVCKGVIAAYFSPQTQAIHLNLLFIQTAKNNKNNNVWVLTLILWLTFVVCNNFCQGSPCRLNLCRDFAFERFVTFTISHVPAGDVLLVAMWPASFNRHTLLELFTIIIYIIKNKGKHVESYSTATPCNHLTIFSVTKFINIHI